jgi:formylglycine-generating enzyme required for sulfatase activity
MMYANPRRFDNNPQHPIDSVSWEDAVAFCDRLSQAEGRTYRLPTEAEWEYARCAGSTTKSCFGDNASELRDHGWYLDNATGRRAHAVAQKDANIRGLFDVHGNVGEWCQDWYGEYGHSSLLVDPIGPSKATLRVFRGGSWFNDAKGCRSAIRTCGDPQYRSSDLGFRVAAVPNT